MPILVDFSQICISNIMMTPNIYKGEVNENICKIYILNALRAHNVKFGPLFGELVICCDSNKSWRKDKFPEYKAKRRDSKTKSKINWSEIYDVIHNLKDDLIKYFPYKIIEIGGAEGDDVIASISKFEQKPILIISGDKDFKQLHKYNNVKQYDPVNKKLVKVVNPQITLNELIISGDESDGIPNIKSQNDSFTNKIRQKSITTSNMEEWSKLCMEDFCTTEDMKKYYKRNEELIDFSFIPDKIYFDIIEKYKNYIKNDSSMLMDYFVANKMRNLLPDISQF